MAELDKMIVDTITSMGTTMKQETYLLKTITERVLDLENRQDTLWTALQGLMGKYNEQERALINLGRRIQGSACEVDLGKEIKEGERP